MWAGVLGWIGVAPWCVCNVIAESGVWWARSWVIARTGVSPGVESIMTGQDGGDSAIGCRIRVSGGGSDTRYRVVAAERAQQSTGGARESRSRE